MHDLVLNYLNLGDVSAVETIQAAGRGGFRATGIRLTGHTPDAAPFDLVGAPKALDELARRSKASGVAIAVFSTYRALPERKVVDYEPVLEAGAALGAPTMAINCFDPDEARAVALIGAVAERAAIYGVKLALEFIPVSAVRTLGDAARVLLATGRKNVGINLDALHLHRSGGSPADIATIEPWLIHSVHLCDALLSPPDDLFAEMRGGRLYPGEGQLPLDEILDMAPPDVELEVEVPNVRLAGLPPEERARAAYEATRAFLDRRASRIARN